MTRVVRFNLFAAAAMAAMAAWVTEGAAQRVPAGGNPDRAALERRVQARYAEMMQQRLGLSDAEAARLSRTMESFAPQRHALVMEEQALRRRMEAFLLEAAAAEDEAKALLVRMEELRVREDRLFRAEQEALLQVLTPVQVVRFHGMRAQLGQRIQQLRGGQGPMGPGAGGGPGRRPPPGDPGS